MLKKDTSYTRGTLRKQLEEEQVSWLRLLVWCVLAMVGVSLLFAWAIERLA